MQDLRTTEERAFIEGLDAMGEELEEKLRQEHFSRGEPLVTGRNGMAMLKHPDGRVTPLDGE